MNVFLLADASCGLDEIPIYAPEEFHRVVVAACKSGARLIALPVIGMRGQRHLLALLAHDQSQRVQIACMVVPADGRYPALSIELAQAQAFEREVAEEHGLVPEGHPWPKPLRRHADLESPGTPDGHPFFRVEGAGVHEVAVGPVHAGIIEPGHFRFQCHGETVLNLEIQLGYQMRGAEKLLLAARPARRMVVAESIAGDCAIGHGLAYATVVERLAGVEAPEAAQSLRAVALELERIACHTGDLGALCGDVGYLPGGAWFGRLRGDFLNLLMELSGSRFGRGLLALGGVRFELPAGERKGFLTRFETAVSDFQRIADVIFDAPSVVSRFERTGSLSGGMAEELGLVGPVARACGCVRDARRDHPEGFYRQARIPIATRDTGDVMARAEVRRNEVGHAVAFIRTQVALLADGALAVEMPPKLRPSSLAVATIEGWRGEIVHVAVTSAEGQIASYKVVDPSFHNWFGLAMAMRGNQISDFPLCNKSFNLSYAGHDSLMQRFLERLRQGHRTLAWPRAPVTLHPRFRGLPVLDASKCRAGCSACADACPTSAISLAPLRLDLGKCLFCPVCAQACPTGAIAFGNDFRVAASTRADLSLDGNAFKLAHAMGEKLRKLLGRSLKLRQVSAGGCNGCEADLNVASNVVVFDLGRFGVQFVASPRHADGIVVTGPVTRNMESALRETYAAVPSPKIVVAFGACAISGGPFADSPECRNGIPGDIPVDLFIPGCPPHPMTFLDGVLRLLGRMPREK